MWLTEGTLGVARWPGYKKVKPFRRSARLTLSSTLIAVCDAVEPPRHGHTSVCEGILLGKKSMHRGARGSITVQIAVDKKFCG